MSKYKGSRPLCSTCGADVREGAERTNEGKQAKWSAGHCYAQDYLCSMSAGAAILRCGMSEQCECDHVAPQNLITAR